MTRIIVGIMGPGDGASAHDCDRAAQLAGLVAAEGWILLTGGRSAGVMEAASAAATRAGGLTIGILLMRCQFFSNLVRTGSSTSG